MIMQKAEPTHLALQELQGSTATSANVAELVLRVVLRHNGSGVTTTDDDSGAVLGSLDRRVEESLGALGELGELEDARGTINAVSN